MQEIKFVLRDHNTESFTYNKEIPCVLRLSDTGVVFEVEGYADNMACVIEYYSSNLEVYVWGEESLTNGGDFEAKNIITADIDSFMEKIDKAH